MYKHILTRPHLPSLPLLSTSFPTHLLFPLAAASDSTAVTRTQSLNLAPTICMRYLVSSPDFLVAGPSQLDNFNMVGFPKPRHTAHSRSGWNDALEKLDVFNLLSLDPYSTTIFREWPRQFRNCSKILHPDKLRGFSPPKGVSMQLLNMVKDWIEAAGDKTFQEIRWNSMAKLAKDGWCSNWNVAGDCNTRTLPIQEYTERQRRSASTNVLAGTRTTPKSEDGKQFVDTIILDRERRPYGPEYSSAEEASKKRKRPASEEQRRRSARPNTPKASYSQTWHPIDDAIDDFF